MSKKRAPGRSLEEWMELVTECRQSGLTDATWCNEHGNKTGGKPPALDMPFNNCYI